MTANQIVEEAGGSSKRRRRVERDYSWDVGTSGWQETNEVHFLYDGNVVVEERDASNVPLVSYTRGNDLLAAPEPSVGGSGRLQAAGGIGGLLARTTYGQELPGAPTTAFYHADGNGNVTALIYPNQQLAAKYLYDPFGNMLAMSGPLGNFNKYRFSSKAWNDNVDLYYYLYRFYDPSLQRWPNRDPLGDMVEAEHFDAKQESIMLSYQRILLPLEAEAIDNPNLYSFLNNSPLSEGDAFGLCPRPPCNVPGCAAASVICAGAVAAAASICAETLGLGCAWAVAQAEATCYLSGEECAGCGPPTGYPWPPQPCGPGSRCYHPPKPPYAK